MTAETQCCLIALRGSNVTDRRFILSRPAPLTVAIFLLSDPRKPSSFCPRRSGAWCMDRSVCVDARSCSTRSLCQKVSLSVWMKSLKNALSKAMRSQNILFFRHPLKTFFGSRASRRRLLHGEMALRARESVCVALCHNGKTGRSKVKYSPAVSIRELSSAVIDRRYSYFACRKAGALFTIIRAPRSSCSGGL